MSVPRKKVFSCVVLSAVVVGSSGPAWRLLAQSRWTIPREPVRTLKTRPAPPAVTRADRGATYHELESKAIRVVTKFADVTAVAERGPDGQLVTELKDRAGNEVATFRVHRVDADNDSLEFTLPGWLTRRAELGAAAAAALRQWRWRAGAGLVLMDLILVEDVLGFLGRVVR